VRAYNEDGQARFPFRLNIPYYEEKAMLKIAIATPPQNGQQWTLMLQCGVEYAVGGINLHPKPDADPDDQLSITHISAVVKI
jgi:hypothetical protein